MTYLIKNLLAEFVNEKRLIKNCYYLDALPARSQVSYITKIPCIQIIISGSVKIIRRQKNKITYKTLTMNDVFFVQSNDNCTIIHSPPVTMLSILYEKQQINCNLFNWDGSCAALIDNESIRSRDCQVNHHLLQALMALSTDYQEQDCETKTFRFLMLSLLNNILFSLSEKTGIYTTKSLRTALICQYIDSHFQNSITREKLADLFHISPNYLSFIFHQEQAIGLNEYILKTRLQHAQKLLLYNQLNIKDIAIASGFQDDGYFRRIFRKKMGCTPTEYKDQHSKKQPLSKQIIHDIPLD